MPVDQNIELICQMASQSDSRSVKMLNIDSDSDIAIFRTGPKHGNVEPISARHWITIDALDVLPSNYEGPVFSVTYANKEYTFDSAQGKNIFERLAARADEEAKADLHFYHKQIAQSGKLYSIYSFFRDRYLDRLSDNEVRSLSQLRQHVSLSVYCNEQMDNHSYVRPPNFTISINKTSKPLQPAK